jgi:hypothetical protein
MKRDDAVGLSPSVLPAGCETTILRDPSQGPFSPREWNKAIDVVAWLSEQAESLAPRGASEAAMSEALGAAFGYMVAYFHHAAIDGNIPHDALAKAVAGPIELTVAQRDFLRAAASSTLG